MQTAYDVYLPSCARSSSPGWRPSAGAEPDQRHSRRSPQGRKAESSLDGPPSFSFLFIEPLQLVDSRERVLLKCIAQLEGSAHLDRIEQHAPHHPWGRRRGLSVHRDGGPLTGKVGDERGAGRGRDDGIRVAKGLFIAFAAEHLGVEEHISHDYKEHSLVHSVTGAGEGEETPQTFERPGPIHIPNQIRPLGRWKAAFSRLQFPPSTRYLQQQRRTRSYKRRMQRNERFSLFLGTSGS